MSSSGKLKQRKNKQPKRLSFIGISLVGLGASLIVVAGAIVLLTFYPLLKAEQSYIVIQKKPLASVEPKSHTFGIVIPKIGANALVVQDVDPGDEKAYQIALSKGVAHAKGTAYPGERGNIFLFAHSSENWYQANRYNAIFFLLYKLTKGDEVILYYNQEAHQYQVDSYRIIEPTEVSYLTSLGSREKLTLMTCWPPGTTMKRLIVEALPK